MVEIYHVPRATGGIIDDRVEVHEGIVPGCVSVAQWNRGARRFSRIGVVGADADGWMAACGGFAGGIISHVPHIALPRQASFFELLRQRLDIFGVDAAA